MFKVFISNYKHIHVRYISHDCIFEDINQLMFFFDILCCLEKFMITKNSVMEVQNLVLNHESRPVKLNPDLYGNFELSIEKSLKSIKLKCMRHQS